MTPILDPFDPTSSKLRPLGEYRDRLPSRRSGCRLNRSTLYRWALRGARSGRVKLKTDCIGGGRFTCDAWVREFMRALAEHDRRREGPADASAETDDEADRQARATEVAARWCE